MRKLALLCSLLVLATTFTIAQKQITTFILVRHAEKGDDGTNDPDLKPEGIERAARLAQMLSETAVDAIYSTTFKRTRSTVAPLAAAKNLEVKTYDAFEVAEIEKMIKKHSGGTVVVSGHSNNIPWIANLLLGKAQYQPYRDSEYGNLLVVSVAEKGKVAKVTWLTY
jgi:2,3-bisphosphoglycerate-dependent phosphoglycerate mutase